MKKVSTYEKQRTLYGYLASLPIVLALLHLAAFIVLQSLLNYDASSGFLNTGALSCLFSISSFGAILCSQSLNLEFVKSLPAVLSIVLGLLFIFFSSKAVKGHHKYNLYSLLLYGLDTLFWIPCMILSVLNVYPLSMSIVQFVSSLLIHLVFLGLLIYTYLLSCKLKTHEEEIKKQENAIFRGKN